MSGLEKETLWALRDKLEKGECTSVDIVTDVLNAIEAHDGKVQAYLSVDREQALADAAAADAARVAGEKGPLLGLPLAIKDLLNVKGQTCCCASQMLKGYVALYDATAIARLREAGAILLGRVNMDEFAMGSSTENSSEQVTHNPWDLDSVPGGSSGGSAAAVAARTAIASIGSDTGGSIRQPASFCGCVGLKPSYGRISRYGLTAYASSLDQIGPLTRSVRDAALLHEVMAGVDELDATSADHPVPEAAGLADVDLTGMKIGLPKEYFIDGMDPEVEQAVKDAVDKLKELGAEIVEVSLPHTRYAVATYYIIATAEASANLARFDGVRYGHRADEQGNPAEMYMSSRADGFGDEVKRRIILGTYVLSSGFYDAYYRRAQRVRTLIHRDFEEAFQLCDALVTPVAPTTAYKIGSKTDDPLQMYLGDIFTVTANLAGICGLSQPCGFSSDGLPIGMQLLGNAFNEDSILRIGHAYEQATDWMTRAPQL